MGWCRCLICTPGLRQSVLWFAVGLATLPAFAGGAELSLTIQSGIEQKRNYDRDDLWTRQWVRILPPKSAAHLLTVQGPDEWLDDEWQPTAPADVGPLNAEHAEVLRAAMAESGLLSGDEPLLLAERVVALLRPVELDGVTAPARRVRIWPLWEVLAYSPDADTLSVAVAAVQTLEEVKVPARIARYPAVDGRYCFGVLMPAPAEESPAGPWAQRAGQDFLLSVALSAKPVADLQPDDIHSWTWQEILAPGWNPRGAKPGETPGEPPAADPPREERKTLPDLCRQAESLNLECVSGDPGEGRQQTLLVLSALILAFLLGWLASLLYQRRLRLLRVWKEKKWRGRNQF